MYKHGEKPGAWTPAHTQIRFDERYFYGDKYDKVGKAWDTAYVFPPYYFSNFMLLSHRYDFTDLAPALPSFLSADASSNVWRLSSDRCTLKWYPDEAHPEDIKWMPRHEKKIANFYSGLREPRLKKGKTPYSKRLRVNQTQYPTNISYFRFSRSWIQSSDCLNFRDPYTLQYTNLIRFELPESSSLQIPQLALIFQDYTFPSFRYFLFKSVLFKPFLLNEEKMRYF